MKNKYVDIEYLGHEENATMLDNPDDYIVIEEKIDGGCFSFFVAEGVIHYRSRNRDLTEEKDEKTFEKERKELLKLLMDKVADIDPSLIYFGEITAKHTINYNNPDMPPFIGFDIKPIEGAFGRTPLFFGRKAKEEAFARIGIPCVALKGVFKADDVDATLIDELTQKSAYYSGKPEGVVLKNYGRTNVWGRQMFAKVVLAEFKETNRAVFGGVKKDNSDTIKMVEEFAVPARIMKRILVLTTEGQQPLDRPLMKHLPIAVIKDIFKEEIDTITKQYKNIDIPILKKLVANKCLVQLDWMIAEKKKEGEDAEKTEKEV